MELNEVNLTKSFRDSLLDIASDLLKSEHNTMNSITVLTYHVNSLIQNLFPSEEKYHFKKVSF